MSNYNISSNVNPEGNPPKSFEDLRHSLQPIEWAWDGWLPKGLLTIMAGASGEGKSALALRIAACITNSLSWPDNSPCKEKGFVVWCEAEASQAVNLDRVTNWGFSAEKFIFPLDDPMQDVNLDDRKHKSQIRKVVSRPGVKLVIVDSLSGSNRRDENSSSILGLLKFLTELARDLNIPIILIHHLRKKGVLDNETVELDRLRGSSAIVQAARVIWALDNPNTNSEYKRLRVIKSNIGAKPEPIGYKVDVSGVRFGNTPEPVGKMTAKDDAVEFLRSILADGPMEVDAIYEKAEEFSIQKRTLNTVKLQLGMRSRKDRGVNGKWFWYMP